MKKKIAPIIVTMIGCVLLLLYGSIPTLAGELGIFSWIFIVIAAGMICVLVANLIKRMRELSEEDDEDIRKY